MKLYVLSIFLEVLHCCEEKETEDRPVIVTAHEKYNRCCGAETQRARPLAVVPSDEPSQTVTEMLAPWQVAFSCHIL